MTKIWGHRLVRCLFSARAELALTLIFAQAEKPTEKAFRSSYRASIHGALVHDASYFQYIELSGTLAQLEALLAEVCDKTAPSPASKRCGFHVCLCSGAIADLTFKQVLGWHARVHDQPLRNGRLPARAGRTGHLHLGRSFIDSFNGRGRG